MLCFRHCTRLTRSQCSTSQFISSFLCSVPITCLVFLTKESMCSRNIDFPTKIPCHFCQFRTTFNICTIYCSFFCFRVDVKFDGPIIILQPNSSFVVTKFPSLFHYSGNTEQIELRLCHMYNSTNSYIMEIFTMLVTHYTLQCPKCTCNNIGARCIFDCILLACFPNICQPI